MAKTTESTSKSFLFRDLDSNILVGMASDRYAGWIGKIYSEEKYEKGITRRSHKVGDKTFNEGTLPVESVIESVCRGSHERRQIGKQKCRSQKFK